MESINKEVTKVFDVECKINPVMIVKDLTFTPEELEQFRIESMKPSKVKPFPEQWKLANTLEE